MQLLRILMKSAPPSLFRQRPYKHWQKNVRQGATYRKLYVQRKLKFLGDTSRVEFYDRGPFELAWRSLLANSLEESYFLTKNSGIADRSKLQRETQVLDELQNFYDRPPNYLSIPQISLHRNTNLFWRASIWFALGEKAKAIEILKELAIDNKNFGLETKNPGHVYGYRVLDLPYEIRLLPRDATGKRVFEVNDPGVVNRFYNPAQVALVACSQLEGSTDDFIEAVGELVFYDYYVVAASGRKVDAVQRFYTAVKQLIDCEELRGPREELIQRLGLDSHRFYEVISRGAGTCGVQDPDRKEIFSPFAFESKVEPHLDDSGSYGQRLIFGGRLNANQASLVADFLKRHVYSSPELQAQAGKLEVSTDPMIGRMKIDE
jgi:hypothetical protein